jgi:hypothetical protein
MRLRETLRKAAGLLVELPPDAEGAAGEEPGAASAEIDRLFAELEGKGAPGSGRSARTVEEIVRAAPGPNLNEIQVPGGASAVTAADGSVDFAALYQQAGLPQVAFTAEQLLEMLASLPTSLPLETRRQTVQVTLGSMGKAIGATQESVVADASRKLAALTAYCEQLGRQTAEQVAAAELEIAALQAQIDEKRRATEAARQQEARAAAACEAESDRLDDVLEFFSLDVPPSKHAPSA